jgi:hypothetical protein
MQPSSAPVSVLPSDWTRVLENIQAALTQALTATAERDRTLAEQNPASDSTTKPDSTDENRIEQLDQGLRRVQSCFQEAERLAADVEVQIQATQDAIQQWRTAASALRQRLVTGPGRSIE